MKDDFAFLFFFLLLVIGSVLKETHSQDLSYYQETEEDFRTVADTATVRVDYSIQYGSIYTGDQTPLFHKGTITLPVIQGVGTHGLPVTGFFPVHTKLPVLINGERRNFYVSCQNQEIDGLLSVNDDFKILMDVYILREERMYISLSAGPTKRLF